MSAWILGLLISARIGAAAGRDAVDEVPNFMKSARPALTRRRLDDCVSSGFDLPILPSDTCTDYYDSP